MPPSPAGAGVGLIRAVVRGLGKGLLDAQRLGGDAAELEEDEGRRDAGRAPGAVGLLRAGEMADRVIGGGVEPVERPRGEGGFGEAGVGVVAVLGEGAVAVLAPRQATAKLLGEGGAVLVELAEADEAQGGGGDAAGEAGVELEAGLRPAGDELADQMAVPAVLPEATVLGGGEQGATPA